MTWLRTREVKPGVHETQSLGWHVGKHVGIVIAAPLVVVVVACLFGGFVGFLLSGDYELAGQLAIAVVPLSILGWYRSWYYKKHPAERGAKDHQGPWD